MNFYKHHLGDYAADTAHLSWDEDCAYRRLLDAYYKREAPIPADIKEACRLARASTPPQRRAVESVLREFFTEESDGWHQKRCDVELGAALAQADTNRRIAAERERRRQERIAHESLNGSGKRNGHESLPTSVNDSLGVRDQSVNLARLQTPDSRLQTPEKPTARPDLQRSEDPPPKPTAAGALSRAMREKNVLSQPSEPRLIALAEAGVTPEQIAQACDAARDAKGPDVRIAPAYVYAIAERWLSEPAAAPPMPPQSVAAEAMKLVEADRATQ